MTRKIYYAYPLGEDGKESKTPYKEDGVTKRFRSSSEARKHGIPRRHLNVS